MYLRKGHVVGQGRKAVATALPRAFLGFLLIIELGSASAAHLLFPNSSSQISRRLYASGQWRIAITRSKFSGEVFCRLQSKDRKVVYVADALGFRFGKHLNVLGAWVQIDGNAPYRWRDDLPELAGSGVAIDGRNLDAPTDGVVWLPAARVDGATRVMIQPQPGKRPRAFDLRGFTSLHDSARALGCAPEARFTH